MCFSKLSIIFNSNSLDEEPSQVNLHLVVNDPLNKITLITVITV